MDLQDAHAHDGNKDLPKYSYDHVQYITAPFPAETEDAVTDILDKDLEELEEYDLDDDWSRNTYVLLMSALNDKIYSYKKLLDTTNTHHGQIELNNEMIYRPENCREHLQKILVSIHLFSHYQW